MLRSPGKRKNKVFKVLHSSFVTSVCSLFCGGVSVVRAPSISGGVLNCCIFHSSRGQTLSRDHPFQQMTNSSSSTPPQKYLTPRSKRWWTVCVLVPSQRDFCAFLTRPLRCIFPRVLRWNVPIMLCIVLFLSGKLPKYVRYPHFKWKNNRCKTQSSFTFRSI